MSPQLPDVLHVPPFTRPVRGEVTLPGSKSLTNRALLLAALCDRPVTLDGALFSEDTHLMIEALGALGFTVRAAADAGTIEVSGQHNGFGHAAPVSLHVGLAGTAARFLTALCAAADRGVYRIDGIPQMRRRPMKGLIDALRALGADIRCTGEEGFFPIEIHARGLRGGEVDVDARASSQILSALLMVAPKANGVLRIKTIGEVRPAFVEMTKMLMGQFGIDIAQSADTGHISVGSGPYRSPGTYSIEPDATAASYFLALPLVTGGEIHVNKLAESLLQGDTRFIEVLKKVGAAIRARNGGIDVSWHPPSPRLGVSENFNEFSDTFLTLAALSPLLAGPTRITGIAHSRRQETDRVSGMARELARLGQDVVETEDSLTITPRPPKSGVEIETYGDHRFAMSFGILGCHDLRGDGSPWLSINNPACCAKTFPRFFERLEDLRQHSLSR